MPFTPFPRAFGDLRQIFACPSARFRYQRTRSAYHHHACRKQGVAMSTVTQVSERPSFSGLRVALQAAFHWLGGATREWVPAGWPDELNDHYLRDAGLEHGSDNVLSEQTVQALRIGSRA